MRCRILILQRPNRLLDGLFRFGGLAFGEQCIRVFDFGARGHPRDPIANLKQLIFPALTLGFAVASRKLVGLEHRIVARQPFARGVVVDDLHFVARWLLIVGAHDLAVGLGRLGQPFFLDREQARVGRDQSILEHPERLRSSEGAELDAIAHAGFGWSGGRGHGGGLAFFAGHVVLGVVWAAGSTPARLLSASRCSIGIVLATPASSRSR